MFLEDLQGVEGAQPALLELEPDLIEHVHIFLQVLQTLQDSGLQELVELSGAAAGRAEHFHDKCDLLYGNVLGVPQGLDDTHLDLLGEDLIQDALLIIAMDEVAELLAAEGGEYRLNPGKHGLMKGSRTPVREDEGLADFFDVFSILVPLDVGQHAQLHEVKQVLTSEPTYSEAACAASHLVQGHLVEAF